MRALKETLEQKQAELSRVLRQRDGITIEKSADQMDEIQYASERDLAIRSANRDSLLLREVKAALGRFRDGSFGACIDCESMMRSEAPRRRAMGPPMYRVPDCG
jgi:RNA polymerase-binding transcription factor DksA